MKEDRQYEFNKSKRRKRCKVSWCEWEAEKNGHCVHHNANPNANQKPTEYLVPELAEHLGVERKVVLAWIDQDAVKWRPYKQTYAVKLEPWMTEFAKSIEEDEPYMAQEPFECI